MPSTILATAVVTASVVLTPVASYASVPLPDQPCTLEVPAKINVGQDVTATVKVCPTGALAGWVNWSLDLQGTYHSLSFSRDGGALYPTADLTTSASEPGTYRISPTASTTFCADECFEIPLLANPVTAKYRTTAGLTVTRSSKGTPTSRVNVNVRRYEAYNTANGTSSPVTVYRDDKVWATTRTNAAGVVAVNLKDTAGVHTYKAVAAETPTTWSATSAVVRK